MPEAVQVLFTLKLLGPPALLTTDGSQVAGLGPGKPLAMLAYLAVRREARREELLELLWGGVPDERARNAFRQALHRLRTALGEELIPQDRERVAVGDCTLLEIDRDQFSHASERGDWLRAVEVYHGDFLEGLDVGEQAFERWTESERARLRTMAEEAHRKAAQEAMDHARWAEATRLATKLSALVPFDESAATLEATILAAAGRPNEALGVLHRFESRLRADLDLETPAEVRALIARLSKTARGRAPDEGPSRARRIKFVGREPELATLLALVRALQSEHGATAVIEGESGIGKSRLVDELIERASVLGRFRVARGREAAMRGAVPFASVAEALRSLADAPGVGGASRHLLAEAARLVPELLDTFDLEPAGAVGDEAARMRFFEGVAALIDAVAYEQPVLLVLDDLQHASASTIDLITYLSQRLRHSPVLLLLVLRSDVSEAAARDRLEALAGSAADAEGVASRPIIRVSPLSGLESERLVAQVVDAQDESHGEAAKRIAALSGGHPERAFEIARRVSRGEHAGSAPVSMREILWARLQAASPAQRRVFFASVLLDRAASLRLLAAAAHLPQGAALEAAERLEQLGLLAPEGDRYRVAHDATSAFVLESSGAAGRALLAGWAADALSREHDARSAELASLYAIAGQSRDAFRHARTACYEAAAAGAGNDVMHMASIALTFAPNAAARREVETLLVPFSGIPPTARLASGGQEVEPPPAPATSAEPIVATPPAPPQASPPTRRWSIGLREVQLALVAAIVIAIGALLRQRIPREGSRRVLADSLVVVERENTNRERGVARIITGSLDGAITLQVAQGRNPWIDSLRVPWVNARLSPDGGTVAVERVTAHGPDVYLMRGGPRDTVRVPGSEGKDFALGWSPDSRVLLIARGRTLSDKSFGAGLYAYRVASGTLTPLDTASDRSVTAAEWSPNGLWIAYAARSGETRQQDIYVLRPDGSERRNITRDPAEDDQPAWSPDASLLAFTSNRSGDRHVYVYDFLNDRIWAVAASSGTDDHPVFAPDGKYLAFESTRDGDAAVYVTLPLGGTATRVTPAGHQFALRGWRGPRAPFADVLRIVGSTALQPHDSVTLSVLALDGRGSPISASAVVWRALDSAATLAGAAEGGTALLRTNRAGEAKIVAAWPGWRSDTFAVSVGVVRSASLSDDFRGGIDPASWRLFGQSKALSAPAPGSNPGNALYPNGNLEWESGALSVATVDLRRPLSVAARAFAPFAGRSMQAATLELALVPYAPDSAISRNAPQFLPFVSTSWNGESGRLTYSVGPQTYSEASADLGAQSTHVLAVTVAADGGVSFTVDGRQRWRSSIRFLGSDGDLRARLWLGGRATYQWGAFSDVRLTQR